MRVIGEDKVEISKEELDVLLMVASQSCSEKSTDLVRDIEISHVANVSVMIEDHIWGNKKIPEEVLMQARDFVRREEGNDAGNICG